LIATWLYGAEDEVEAFVRIILVQTGLEVGRHRMIGEIHCAPFDVKDTIRRAA
jgi:hypothetical protein